jgi:hypothetical protein
MVNLYLAYKQILEDKMTALGFTAIRESTAGLARGITFEKNGFEVSWGYDHREQTLTLTAKKDGQKAGYHYFNSSNIKTNFPNALVEIMSAQGFEIEAPAPPVMEKSGGFLSKLFGKK